MCTEESALGQQLFNKVKKGRILEAEPGIEPRSTALQAAA